MRLTTRPVARLGMALTAAVLGLAMATATAVAHADPTDTDPPSTTTTEPPPSDSPAETAPESTPPSSESSTPAESSAPAERDPASLEDVTVHATFDKPSYATGERMTITLTLHNESTEPVRLKASFPAEGTVDGVTVTGTSTFPERQWLDLAAGETVTNVLTGVAVNPAVDTATLTVRLDTGDADREATFTVPVTPRSTQVSGVVFYDRNLSGTPEWGEGLAGVTLTWTSRVTPSYRPTVMTNADGEYSIGLAPGSYLVDGTIDGFVIDQRAVAVTESTMDKLDIVARPGLANLTADLDFTKDTYKPEESPTVTVTLTNNDDRYLSGITASCWAGDANVTDARWGDLSSHGTGISLAAHSTRVFHFTQPMPARSYDYGYVGVDCRFGYPDRPGDEGKAHAEDYATVPGLFVDFSGQFFTFHGYGIAGVQVTLTGPEGTCPIIATATSGQDGRFSIKHLPAGRYLVYAVPPPDWNHSGGEPLAPTTFVAGEDYDLGYFLTPLTTGPPAIPPPNCPGTPGGGGNSGGGGGGGTPNPQGSGAPGLAYTGASMIVPGVAGLLALLAGTGAVVLTRRRRNT